jgi:hypothetical protein
VESAVGSVRVWGVWSGPWLVWMGCCFFAAVLWGAVCWWLAISLPEQSVIVGEVG